jgi:hypothetical protein
MATKPKRPASKRKQTASSRSKKPPTTLQIFVRRGALRRFAALKGKSADLPVVVLWDQRTGERRTMPTAVEGSRRKGERRKEEPFTWTAADFVLVEKPVTPPPAPPKRPRRSKKARGN